MECTIKSMQSHHCQQQLKEFRAISKPEYYNYLTLFNKLPSNLFLKLLNVSSRERQTSSAAEVTENVMSRRRTQHVLHLQSFHHATYQQRDRHSTETHTHTSPTLKYTDKYYLHKLWRKPMTLSITSHSSVTLLQGSANFLGSRAG